ncbi:MAG: M28 family peptidase [Nitrospirae bacterium]|nr:M28 family peptidase [Nitrospirota bacterium]NTW67142.1 M28 family peptidase [Nitrospirota bacterium]
MDMPVDKERLRQDVHMLTDIDPPRNARNVASLDRCASTILDAFKTTRGRIDVQRFTQDGKEYKNVICSLGPEAGERIVVGAHYDVQGDQPGADDNASGVAGLLELGRLVSPRQGELDCRIDLAAYTLEEGQYVRHPIARHFGSYLHARSLSREGASVRCMICLEMIGYFTDRPHSQRYPVPFMHRFYPDQGNFIAVIGKWGQGRLVKRVHKAMADGSRVPVRSLTTTPLLPGVSFSDHESFWKFGYPAVMITDSAFYRNRNYHRTSDRADTLDYDTMAEVVKGLYWTVLQLGSSGTAGRSQEPEMI